MHVPEYITRPKLLIPTLIGFLLSGLAWGETAGRVNYVSGEVVAVKADNTRRVLSKGDAVNSGERLETGERSRIQIRFTDGGFLSLQPNTVFSLDTYRYTRDKPDQSSLVFNFLRGGMRTISGAIGKVNRSAYQIKTPTATIGIRGTDYSGLLLDNELILKVLEGMVNLSNAVGNADVPAGQTYSVRLNAAPAPYSGTFPLDIDPIQPDVAGTVLETAAPLAAAGEVAGDLLERPRLENYENYNQFLQAMYAYKKAEAARLQASQTPAQPTLDLAKIQNMAPMEADLETDTVDSPVTPSLVTEGPQTIEAAIADAQNRRLPYYAPGENYQRSTFRDFPLKPAEPPALQDSSIDDSFKLGAVTSQMLLNDSADKQLEDNSNKLVIRPDLVNKSVTMDLERGDHILRIFGNIVQINGLSDMTITIHIRD